MKTTIDAGIALATILRADARHLPELGAVVEAYTVFDDIAFDT